MRRYPTGRRKKPFLPLVMAAVLVIGLMILNVYIQPVLFQLASSAIRNEAIKTLDFTVHELIGEGEIRYDSLVSLEKDQSGRITALKSNMVEINRLQSTLVSTLIDRISHIDSTELSIPLGNLFGGSLLSGRGPGIPVRVLSVNSAEAEFSNAFASAGINQTRHQILLTVFMEISILLPGSNTQTEVSSQVVVAETVIVGSVPESYTYFNYSPTGTTEWIPNGLEAEG